MRGAPPFPCVTLSHILNLSGWVSLASPIRAMLPLICPVAWRLPGQEGAFPSICFKHHSNMTCVYCVTILLGLSLPTLLSGGPSLQNQRRNTLLGVPIPRPRLPPHPGSSAKNTSSLHNCGPARRFPGRVVKSDTG